ALRPRRPAVGDAADGQAGPPGELAPAAGTGGVAIGGRELTTESQRPQRKKERRQSISQKKQDLVLLPSWSSVVSVTLWLVFLLIMSEPKATHDYCPGELTAALEFLKRTRSELRSLRKARVWRDRIEIFDINGDWFEVRNIGWPDADLVELLRAVNA